MAQRNFIPCTMARSIGEGVFFRPIRSWHSGTYAGEGLFKIPNSTDGSGCLREETARYPGSAVGTLTSAPLTVTHRLYWHTREPHRTLSAFLSYPNAMGAYEDYFWETYWPDCKDIERFIGEDAEERMEDVIRSFFTK